MSRIVVIGNAAGGKSTLARALAQARRLPLVEIDKVLWQPGWTLTPAAAYARKHRALIAKGKWIIEGLGSRDSIAPRIRRATEIILIDMPLWQHYALAAERQIAWKNLAAPPASASEMPPTEALFRTMDEVDKDWMPLIRRLCRQAKRAGKAVTRLASLDELNAFTPA
jgi:adenylate kinase family enzyme